ncbi:ATP-binding protein [Arcobacter sp. YIC-464]|uniref:ATP-binding protein n=1 Tax=Arcobacter sp. YIC-464 TaxID=3376631 RepID=UPI003C26A346
MIKEKSLKKEISQLYIVICVSIIIVMGVFSAFNLYKNRLNSIDHSQEQVLTQVEYEINNFINNTIKVENYLKKNYFTNSSIINNIVEIDRNISSVLVLSKDGIIENFAAIQNLNIYKGFDYSNKRYFKEIRNENDTFWSSVFLSSVDEEPSISYSFMHKEKVFVFLIKFTDVSNFIKRFKNIDKSHMIRVFDNDGTIIINPDANDMVLQRFNASYSGVYESLINKVEPYEQVTFNPIKGNKTQYGTYVNIKKTNWKVVVREDYTKVIDLLMSTLYLSFLSIIVFSFLSIYISLKFSKKIFSVFDKLQDTTRQIANGNYSINLEKSNYLEFNKLISSFNKMKKEVDKREEYLEESLDSFKSLFNSTLESIVLTKDAKIIDVNDVTIELLGAKDKNDFVGKSMMDFISPEYRNLVKKNLQKDTEPYEVELIKLNKEKINVFVQGKLLNFLGETVRLTAVIDITDVKQKDRLLFQQSKMASMGEMIGNIAHQWRQPLSVITTCASGIRLEKELDSLTDERLNVSIENIIENCKYLSKTIDDFRNFFKKDRVLEEFDLNEYINKVLKLVGSSLKNNEIDVDLNFEKDLYLKGVPSEFMQVIINLINNSKDAFVLNNIEIRNLKITTKIENKNIKIEIIDNAGGISESIIDKIFEPYFTTKHKSKGTGIGLYMSHQIITEHFKGSINVKNNETLINEKVYPGTNFTILIPTEIENQILDYTI